MAWFCFFAEPRHFNVIGVVRCIPVRGAGFASFCPESVLLFLDSLYLLHLRRPIITHIRTVHGTRAWRSVSCFFCRRAPIWTCSTTMLYVRKSVGVIVHLQLFLLCQPVSDGFEVPPLVVWWQCVMSCCNCKFGNLMITK